MKKTIVILLTLLASCAVVCSCSRETLPEATDLADYLNETNAVIGAGDTYDEYILIDDQPMSVGLMRIFSNQGYNVDYPYMYFEYYTDRNSNYLTDSGSDRFIWAQDSQSAPVNYIEISRLSSGMADTADLLEQKLAEQFECISRTPAQFNVCSAELLRCSAPTDSTIPADALLDCYVVNCSDGCRVVSVHYTETSADTVYPYMQALLDRVELAIG